MVTGRSRSDWNEMKSAIAAEIPASMMLKEISILDLLIIVAQGKRLILSITLFFALVAVGASLLLPSRYTATVTLLPPQQSSTMSSTLASQLSGMGGMASLASSSLGIKNVNEMYVAMIKSRMVEDAMVMRFNLVREYKTKYASDARKIFDKTCTVDGSGKEKLIRISVTTYDPRRAADMANGYVEEYRKFSANLAIAEASQRRLLFGKQLEKAKNDLVSAEESLKGSEQKTGVIQLDSQTKALIKSVVSLHAQVAAKEVQLQAMRTYATGENAQLIQVEQELADLRAQQAKLSGNSAGSSGGMIISKGKVSEAGLDYARKVRNVKYYETIYDLLARQLEAAKLDKARQGALIQVVDPAIPPERRSFPKRVLIVIGATFAGFLIGIGLTFALQDIQRIQADPESNAKLNSLISMLLPKRKEKAL